MIIGLRSVELFIPLAHSLKEKRQVLRRIKDRVKSRLNVSYAETGYHDKWQRSALSFVTVAHKRSDVDRRLDNVLSIIAEDPRIEFLKVENEYL